MKSPVQMIENAVGRPVEQLLYGYGARLNVPWSALRMLDEAIDFTRAPVDYVDRKRLARRVTKNSPWRGKMTRETGYCYINAQNIPAIASAIATAKAIKSAQEKKFSHSDTKKHAFTTGILSSDELRSYPALVDLALSPEITAIISDYLGTVPRLCAVDFMYTEAVSSENHDSQLWHLDKPEVNYLACFICVNEVDQDNGPFTFLPAAASEKVCNATDYYRRSALGDGRLSDDDLDRHRGGKELMTLQGPAGAGIIVDTSRCLHYGARLNTGSRFQIVLRYGPAHRVFRNRSRQYEASLANGDRVRMKLLSGGVPLPTGFGD